MSIYGTGIDVIEIARIERAVKRKGFLQRVFGPSELDFFAMKGWPARSIAANFCAKEAFAKALGTGLRSIKLAEIEVLRKENGQPYFKLSGTAESLSQSLNLRLHLSLSHERTFACAIVVAERDVIS